MIDDGANGTEMVVLLRQPLQSNTDEELALNRRDDASSALFLPVHNLDSKNLINDEMGNGMHHDLVLFIV